MSKPKSLLFLVLISFLLSCSGNSPKKVAQKFLKESEKMNYEEAKKYSTPETSKMLDMMASLVKMSPEHKPTKHQFKVIGEKIEGESATVTYKEKGNDELQMLHLKKVDGKWLVDVSKNDITTKESQMPQDTTAAGRRDSASFDARNTLDE